MEYPEYSKKCGIKTAAKYYENRALFEERLDADNAIGAYELNTTLIDFSMIPQKYVDDYNSGNYTSNYTHPSK